MSVENTIRFIKKFGKASQLDKFVTHPDPRVRSFVASQDKLTVHQLGVLSKDTDLKSDHISNIINNNNENAIYNLIVKNDLESHHVDNILTKNNPDLNYAIAHRRYLKPHHIDKLISFHDDDVNGKLKRRADLNNQQKELLK